MLRSIQRWRYVFIFIASIQRVAAIAHKGYHVHNGDNNSRFAQQWLTQRRDSQVVVNTTFGAVRGRVELAETFVDADDRLVFAFRGLPYALPPVGRRRWSSPRPLPELAWTYLRDAGQFGAACLQYDTKARAVRGSEDCLLANVYTPFLPSHSSLSCTTPPCQQKAHHLLPVIVAVHGGGFEHGSSSQLGAIRLLREDVMLVTINYRLGVFGFLASQYEGNGDAQWPGNYALLDVIEALRWVRRVAAEFGGDRQRVTLMGHGTGAALVHLVSSTSLSAGLFHRMALHSGSALCPWSLQYEQRRRGSGSQDTVMTLAAAVGCSVDGGVVRRCLQHKPAALLVRVQQSRLSGQLLPVVDAGRRSPATVQDLPRRVLNNSRTVAPVPLLVAAVANEEMESAIELLLNIPRVLPPSSFASSRCFSTPSSQVACTVDKVLVDLVYQTLMSSGEDYIVELSGGPSVGTSHQGLNRKFDYQLKRLSEAGLSVESLVNKVKQHYLLAVDYGNLDSVLPALSRAMSDARYSACHRLTLQLHTASSVAGVHSLSPPPVFAFLLDYRRLHEPSRLSQLLSDLRRRGDLWTSPAGDGVVEESSLATAVTHGDDLFYLFSEWPVSSGDNGSRQRPTADDQYVSAVITRLWANFAAAATPTAHVESDATAVLSTAATSGSLLWPRCSHNRLWHFRVSSHPVAPLADYARLASVLWQDTLPRLAMQQVSTRVVRRSASIWGWTVLAVALLVLLLAGLVLLCRRMWHAGSGTRGYYDVGQLLRRIRRRFSAH